MSLAFFGLTPEAAPLVRQNLFNQIHEIVFHGQGGYTWTDVYEMPIWLRRYTFRKLQDYYKEKNEDSEKQQAEIKRQTSKHS